ncbi:head GIN domain-containing protein [Bradyrhizobium sp. HKCCYLS3077]|uniref:head GIN domain-containing protein n=1 Tax=Bradyrhizobium sp. HKCCYLS3077 TaxID=3420761 RepID=UPI003EBC7B07
MASRELLLSPFSSLALSIPALVAVTQGDKQRISARGDDSLIDLLALVVENQKWNIQFLSQNAPPGELEIYVTLPSIDSLFILGSGDIRSQGVLQVSDVALSIQGSGGMNLDIRGRHAETSISGSGNLELSGQLDDCSVVISGSGNYLALGLASRDANVKISGSGIAELFVTNKLSARISGSGNVYYVGAPVLDVRITGSGRVVRRN